MPKSTPRPGTPTDGAAVYVAPDSLAPHPRNPRVNDAAVEKVADSIRRFGFGSPIVARKADRVVIAGHTRLKAAQVLRLPEVPVRFLDLSEDDAMLLRIADNKLGEEAYWDEAALAEILHDLRDESHLDLDALLSTGLSPEEIDALLAPPGEGGAGGVPDVTAARRTLAERFLVPPFSVLDARAGYWQVRKRAWIALGIRSEVGRGENLLRFSETVMEPDAAKRAHGRRISTPEFRRKYWVPSEGYRGTSIFDPVLCEVIYRWFCPPGGRVLDPFAGGSVRGVVAGMVGRAYIGIDLSAAQVAANEAQRALLFAEGEAEAAVGLPASERDARAPIEAPTGPMPIERVGGLWMKRDDRYEVAGVRGGKVRTCWSLAQGAQGLVTATSRSSPQGEIVAFIGRALGVPVRIHTPTGALGPELVAARAAGAEVVQHRAGRNSVLIARAREDAAARTWTLIPFGMECGEAVAATASEVRALPAGVTRLVVPVGSGMSLAGILRGLAGLDRRAPPVVGVVVGADPTRRLDRFAPPDWRSRVELVRAATDYHEAAAERFFNGVALDPHYEAKCIPLLRPDDLLWVVGQRRSGPGGWETAEAPQGSAAGPSAGAARIPPEWVVGDSAAVLADMPEGESFDCIFSCPPYGDLEVYSDDPRDLSVQAAKDHEAFLGAYGRIIAEAVRRLRPDRFACFVVGDYRSQSGALRNFVAETTAAFHAAGARLYNEAVLVTAVGSLPIRAARAFSVSRKLGKTHQNVLVFVKGDPRRATEAVGEVEVHVPEPEVGTGAEGAEAAGGTTPPS